MEVPKNTSDVAGAKVITPEVTWAQRSSTSDPERNHIFLTISVPDVDKESYKLDLQPTSLEFSGYSSTRKAQYAVKLDLFAEVDPEHSKISHTSKNVELVLRKKELKEEYWPRLLKDKAKVHFLKTDFDKWVDEDEQDEQAEGDDDYMSKMGGMGGMPGMGGMGGMPGMGGMGGMPGMGGMGGMPGMEGLDFSKLGGMGGMGGMPGMDGMDDDEGDDDVDDDDGEMPGLEGEGEDEDGQAQGQSKAAGKAPETAPAGGSSSKIEEIE